MLNQRWNAIYRNASEDSNQTFERSRELVLGLVLYVRKRFIGAAQPGCIAPQMSNFDFWQPLYTSRTEHR